MNDEDDLRAFPNTFLLQNIAASSKSIAALNTDSLVVVSLFNLDLSGISVGLIFTRSYRSTLLITTLTTSLKS